MIKAACCTDLQGNIVRYFEVAISNRKVIEDVLRKYKELKIQSSKESLGRKIEY